MPRQRRYVHDRARRSSSPWCCWARSRNVVLATCRAWFGMGIPLVVGVVLRRPARTLSLKDASALAAC